MLTFSTKSLNTLRRDDRGSILPLFGIMFAFVMLAAGAAVDAGRVYDAQSRLASAADAAAIAAGKALLDGRNSDAEVVQIATQYFNANLSTGADNTVAVNSFNVTVDRATNTVKVDLAADVSMTLTRIAGFDKVEWCPSVRSPDSDAGSGVLLHVVITALNSCDPFPLALWRDLASVP